MYFSDPKLGTFFFSPFLSYCSGLLHVSWSSAINDIKLGRFLGLFLICFDKIWSWYGSKASIHIVFKVSESYPCYICMCDMLSTSMSKDKSGGFWLFIIDSFVFFFSPSFLFCVYFFLSKAVVPVVPAAVQQQEVNGWVHQHVDMKFIYQGNR